MRIFDPFCGSGTFLLETLIESLGVPIRLNTPNSFINWPIYDEEIHRKVIKEMQEKMREQLSTKNISIIGSDISNTQLKNSWSNFESIGSTQ